MRMRLLVITILLSLVSAGIYYRVLQVAIFAVAAALHSPWQSDFSISREAADGWASVTPKTVIQTTHLSGTAVTYHPEYHDFQASQARRGIQEAAALGVEFLRADVRWSAVLPDGVTPDKTAFAWYRSFFETARAYGLKPLIVLTSPPETVRHLPQRELLNRWGLFVEQVVSHLGESAISNRGKIGDISVVGAYSLC